DGVLLAIAVPDRPDRAAEHRAEVDTGLVRLGRGEVDAVVVVPGAGLRVDAPAPLAGDPADDRADRVRTGPLQAERPCVEQAHGLRAGAAGRGARHLLVAEDDAHVRELLAPRGEAPVDSRHHGVARLLV